MLVLSICEKKNTETLDYLLIQEYFAISALKYLPREKSAGISCHNHFVKMVIGTSRESLNLHESPRCFKVWLCKDTLDVQIPWFHLCI